MSTIYPVPHALLILISGPAGCGKTTLAERLVLECPDFQRIVTATTRLPRPGESSGRDYEFFEPDEFKRLADVGYFLEVARIHGADDRRLYGTPRASVYGPLRRGQNLITAIDVAGVRSFRAEAERNPALKRAMATVFVGGDIGRFESRLRSRGMAEDEIGKRMATARNELLEAPLYDATIVSGTKDEDFAALRQFVERARFARQFNAPLYAS